MALPVAPDDRRICEVAASRMMMVNTIAMNAPAFYVFVSERYIVRQLHFQGFGFADTDVAGSGERYAPVWVGVKVCAGFVAGAWQVVNGCSAPCPRAERAGHLGSARAAKPRRVWQVRSAGPATRATSPTPHAQR